MELKKIALNDLHATAGAKMVGFAGYNMPVRYTSDKEEHLCVRNGVGIFDVSHMGEFMLRGPKAFDLVQKISSNDAEKLFDGKAQYACMPNETGGIVDDFLIYRISEMEYMLVVNASNIQKDWAHISKYNTFGVEMEDISDTTSLFAIQGPKAVEAMQSLTKVDLAAMKYYTFQIDTFAEVPNVVISATGYTGAGGFEIYVPNQYAELVWKKVLEAGADFGIKPIGLAARDTLRLEMGLCLYGNDIDDTTSPLEAGLGWVTKFTKDFVNAEALKQMKGAGVTKKLVGFRMLERGIPRKDYPILNGEGQEVGRVTSGTMSPVLNIGIGMGYVPTELAKVGTSIQIGIRGRGVKAEVVKRPFI